MGLKREEVIGNWRKLYSQELNDLYLHKLLFGSLDQGRRNGQSSGTYGGKEKLIQYYGGEDRSKWWDDNIKIYLEERRWGGIVRICLAHDRGKWLALVKQ
jgi:hypothetical protein